MRVAVIYSGRWYGTATPQSWVENHLKRLIVPNKASVFVVTDADNWCHAPDGVRAKLSPNESYAAYDASSEAFQEASRHFAAGVAHVFRSWSDVHASLLPVELLRRSDHDVGRVEFLQAQAYMLKLNKETDTILHFNLQVHMRRWYYRNIAGIELI
jgi:hypothetical protein